MIADTAKIDPSAKIAPGVAIGHYSIIGPDVVIGEGTDVGPHVVIKGPTTIGQNNKFYQFASIGEDPQDKKYKGEKTELIIGNDNVFRECTTVSRGTTQGGNFTRIGHDNLFMAYVHVAHDCIIGSHTIFSNNASLAGHVEVGDYAILGGFVGVHQFCSIGAHSFCAGASIIIKDVLPFVMIAGHPSKPHGLNLEGLKRRQFTPETIQYLKNAYKILFRQGLTVESAIEQIELLAQDCPQIQTLIDFVKASKRGLVR